jgi:hypothetical protein
LYHKDPAVSIYRSGRNVRKSREGEKRGEGRGEKERKEEGKRRERKRGK